MPWPSFAAAGLQFSTRPSRYTTPELLDPQDRYEHQLRYIRCKRPGIKTLPGHKGIEAASPSCNAETEP